MNQGNTTAPTARDWATKLGIKAYRYRALLKRRWWIPAVAISVGLLFESWLLIQQPVTFQSIGSLVVGIDVVTNGGAKIHEQEDGFYNTVIKTLQSDTILNSASRSVSLKSPDLHGTIQIVATLEPRTNIFRINGHGSDPQYTQLYVDAVMQEYIQYRRKNVTVGIDSTIKSIRDELDKSKDQLAKDQKALQDFSEQNNMPFWKESLKNSMDTFSDLQKQKNSKTAELNQLMTLTSDQLLNRPVTNTGGPGDASSAGGGTSPADLNQQYLQTSQELAQKNAELAERLKVWRPEHPGIKKIKDEIERLNTTIKSVKELNVQSTKSRVEVLKTELQQLEVNIAEANKKVLEASRKDGEFQRLQSSIDNDQNLFNKLMEQIGNISGAGSTPDNVTVMEQASAATRVPPGYVKHLLIGFILGLVVGCMVLYFLDRADDRISSSTEMIEYFSESILGQIPNVDESRGESGLPLLQHDDDRYTFAESFRSLRSSLIFMPNQGELKTLIVTSSIPGEGKSTITSNLSITMALAGARVLVVDADLRRGDLAALFNVDGRVGLSSVLRGEVNWRDAVQKTHHPTLTLLPRGPVTNQSGELLLLPTFEPMLNEFKENFDLVIFNTSPILATDDTPTIAPNFDGTLMVIRAQFTGARLVHNSLNALYQRQVNVLGLILNCVDTEMPDYYYYRYPKYYAV